ncbi:DUF2239 family protein [Nannocystis sp. SCPEA4]|uniref:DUF2239 family protein n=1 Tax=Nannocystis sp. SCPEA4 TaxID=2996787 RepID=UPI00227045E3|nr:DUF2239 family protein [Nannocystis sp. SCPEA4]
MDPERTYTAFAGPRRLASGSAREVLQRLREAGACTGSVLVFDDASGHQVELDATLAAEEPPVRAGPGRPKLGVVSREVSLLPRHWEWLEQQPSGISAALRRLVEEAIRRDPDEERARLAREAAHRVMTALAGDLPNYEEAARALFARDSKRFAQQIRRWPADIRDHLARMVERAFPSGDDP